MSPAMPVDLWAMFLHFMAMSLLSIGGAVATVPDIHRFVVEERGWLAAAMAGHFVPAGCRCVSHRTD